MGVIDAIRARGHSGVVATPDEPRSAACLNCGAPLDGPFCSACGQRDVPAYPSVRELASDAFVELSGWDGRFAATVRALVRHPGKLTREFLEGRRARYISPVRLYLAASVVYFLLSAGAPNLRLDSGTALGGGPQVGVTITGAPGGSRAERVSAAAGDALRGEQALSPEERAAALEQVARAPALIQPFLRRAIEDPGGYRRDMLTAMPRMLFVLLPIFAAIVALFYRGRRYPEHLYFAIHLNTFVFLALGLSVLSRYTRSVPLAAAVGVLTLLSIPAYATLALRRVYGGSIAGTLLKELGIAALYGAVAFVAFVVTVYVVSVAG